MLPSSIIIDGFAIGTSINSTLQFLYSITSYTVSFNIPQLATELKLMSKPVNVTAILLPFDANDLLISISPATLNITLQETSSVATSISSSVSYIVSSSDIPVSVSNTCTVSVSTVTTVRTILPTATRISTVYVTGYSTASITANTVYVTVQPTDTSSTQASSNNDTNSSIIGGILVVVVVVMTVISIIAAVITYRCGKSAGKAEIQMSGPAENARYTSTEMKRIPESSINPVLTSAQPHNELYSEMASPDPPPPLPPMRSKTASLRHSNISVDTEANRPRAYSSIVVHTIEKPNTYDDVTAPLPPPPELGEGAQLPEAEEVYEEMTSSVL